MLAGAAGLGWRLYQLQVVRGAELQSRARQQQVAGIKPYIPRRAIVDSQGNVLATDRLGYTLYAHPKLFKFSREEVAAKLAPILENMNPPEILKRLRQRETGIRLVNGLSEAAADRIRQLSLDGIDLEQAYERFYPQQDMVADAIGYVDRDRQGQAGIESSQRHVLQQDLLSLQIRRTGMGTLLPAGISNELLNFDDLQLQLTLDLRLQQAARNALRKQLKQYNGKRGAVIVMDARDGSLLALACEPTYNPNAYYKSKVELFKNWSIGDLYEPGSTFKPINVAIALDAGVIKPSTIIHDGGSVTIDGWTINNSSKVGYGTLDIAKVLQTSSNIGMVQIVQKMKKEDYYQRLQNLGLSEKTGIDLPGEAPGHLKSKEVFTAQSIEAATAAFGQGFSLTPMKLVQLHASLANGGILVTPHAVRGLVDGRGKLHWQPSLPSKRVYSPEAAKSVVEMMETVVTKGTGKVAQIPGYRIGGKTGTAQKAGPRGGYIANAKITSFISILPVDSPRYVVLAVVDEPQGGNTFGATVAAPIVKSVMEALISLKGIPPSQ
jgi:cell division protein FtsI (penicillin-binding protein 3)